MGRPRCLVAVTSTGTEVGKTWLTAQLCRALRSSGVSVAARKPAQSFDPSDPEPTDASVLAAASGDAPERVCPPHRWYAVPLAPPMAAEQLGLPPWTVDVLCRELRWPVADVGFVEGAGGLRSPLADDGDNRDFIEQLDPDVVVLVSGAGLGTIHDVRLATEALAPRHVIVYLNRFDPTSHRSHALNRSWLSNRDGFDVLVDPLALADRLKSLIG